MQAHPEREAFGLHADLPYRPPLHVDVQGRGPRTLWVHGAMDEPTRTWQAQSDLAARWTLMRIARRGTPPSPPAEGNNYQADADDIVDLLDAPAHVVAHSYGCVGALLAAKRVPERVITLALIEPPLYQLMPSDSEVMLVIERFEALRRIESADDYLPAFLATFLGGSPKRRPLSAEVRKLVELCMRERPPWTAQLPLDAIRESGLPVLVVSGGHSRLLELCADALARCLDPHATRLVLPGAGHAVQRLGKTFNDELEQFWREQAS